MAGHAAQHDDAGYAADLQMDVVQNSVGSSSAVLDGQLTRALVGCGEGHTAGALAGVAALPDTLYFSYIRDSQGGAPRG